MTSRPAAAAEQTTRAVPNYVGGESVKTATRVPNVNPVDGRVEAEVCHADRALVDRAVEAARAALQGSWGNASLAARRQYLYRIADAIEARFDDFLAAEIADTGKPAHQARALDIPRSAANFRMFADLIGQVGLDCYEQDTEDHLGALNYAVRRPVGVVAVICPWNLPLLLMTWKVAPALACGNTVIAKPSEETPSSAALLAEVMQAVGVPPGVFNVVNGFGPGSAGEWLTTHEGIDAITFTGESATGARIMRAAADGVKAVSFELGGKNAAVVFADADFDAAVAGIVLLLLYYIAAPPFAGYTYAMPTEGSYLVVNKILIEAAALLLLIAFPTRSLFGVDRLFAWNRSARPANLEQAHA